MTKRSERKSARPKRARARYTDEQKDEALDLLREEGMAAAHDATGVPKGTLSGWAQAAGIDLASRARDRTAAASATVEAKAAELKLDTVSRLERILGLTLDAWEDLATFEAQATTAMRDTEGAVWADFTDLGGLIIRHQDTEVSQALGRLTLLRQSMTKRDVVGAAGLAVDKLELLTGKATERGELVVRFGIPRPDFAKADREAIDLPPRED